MNSMVVAANAVIPIAAFMFLGSFLKARGIVGEKSFQDFNWLVFHLCLPITLFTNIQGMDPEKLSNPGIVLFCCGTLLLLILLSMFLVSFTSFDNRQKGVIVQAIYRSNFVILGVPIVQSIYGSENIGVTSLIIAFVVPLFNIVSVLVLQKYSQTEANFKQTITNLITNPLIIGAFLGFLYKFLPITLPRIVLSFIEQVANMSTPLSLLVLGGSFQFLSIRNNIKPLVLVTIARLVVVPFVVLTIATSLGYRGVELASILVLFAGPVAIASFSMAQQMGLDGELAAQCVMVTTIGVILTMFLFITGLGTLGLL